MLKDPVAAGVNMQMDELRRLMVENHQRYLPVMDDTTLMGVVSFHDVAGPCSKSRASRTACSRTTSATGRPRKTRSERTGLRPGSIQR
jgi:CBS-domain-containing membrane protein